MTSIQSMLFASYLAMFAILTALYSIVFGLFQVPFPDTWVMAMILSSYTMYAMTQTWKEEE